MSTLLTLVATPLLAQAQAPAAATAVVDNDGIEEMIVTAQRV